MTSGSDMFWPDDPPADEKIRFYSELAGFDPPAPDPLVPWIEAVIASEGARLRFLQFIFCSDDDLLQKNREYLRHDTYTDVITFPYQDPPIVEGDVFISVDRVFDNARKLDVAFSTELHRVMIHGVLHLCGYTDENPAEKARMRDRENAALEQLHGKASPPSG